MWLTGMLDGIMDNHLTMKNRVQQKLIGLVAAIVLVWLGIAFLTVRLQQQWGELRTQLKQVDSESFRIADQFRDSLRQLNESLYHYGRSHVLPDVAAFNHASHELDLWIDSQKPKLATSREKTVMEQIDAA